MSAFQHKSGTMDFLADLRGRLIFWRVYQRDSCINSISDAPHLSLSSLTSCSAPRPSTCTQRQILFRCSLNSAAPLALCFYTSCTQTLNKVNSQRSALSTKQWHTDRKPAITVQSEYQLPKTATALSMFKPVILLEWGFSELSLQVTPLPPVTSSYTGSLQSPDRTDVSEDYLTLVGSRWIILCFMFCTNNSNMSNTNTY